MPNVSCPAFKGASLVKLSIIAVLPSYPEAIDSGSSELIALSTCIRSSITEVISFHPPLGSRNIPESIQQARILSTSGGPTHYLVLCLRLVVRRLAHQDPRLRCEIDV